MSTVANKSLSQPSARTFSIVDIVSEVRRGRVRIPEFQRPLRWQWEDVRRLFDSIVKGYPIGNLLLWQRTAPSAYVVLGGLSFEAPEFSDGWWVVDGQQRLISLANALSENGAQQERFALAYNLKQGLFCHVPPIEDPFVVPLPVLFDLQRLFRWFVDHPEAIERLDDASRITKAIREFTIPAYVVEQDDEAILRDIFDRMNTSGKQLSRAEVFSALHPGTRDQLTPHSSFESIIATVERECGFGELDDDTVLRAVLARRGPDVSRDIHSEFVAQTQKNRDFGEETQDAAYREGEQAILRAVEFLQTDACVPHFAFLPYRYLLVVLARFFAHFPNPAPQNRRLLRRWFWRAAMLGVSPFRGSWTGAMRALAGRIVANQETDSVSRLLQTPIDRPFDPPNLERFNTKAAESRVVVCALWAQEPRSFTTGEVFDRDKLSDAMTSTGTLSGVLGRILRREPQDHNAWAANRMFVLDDVPINGTSDLLTVSRLPRALFGEVLKSHAANEDMAETLARDERPLFLKKRQGLIKSLVDTFLLRMAEQDFEDTPPLEALDLDDDDGARDDA